MVKLDSAEIHVLWTGPRMGLKVGPSADDTLELVCPPPLALTQGRFILRLVACSLKHHRARVGHIVITGLKPKPDVPLHRNSRQLGVVGPGLAQGLHRERLTDCGFCDLPISEQLNDRHAVGLAFAAKDLLQPSEIRVRILLAHHLIPSMNAMGSEPTDG